MAFREPNEPLDPDGGGAAVETPPPPKLPPEAGADVREPKLPPEGAASAWFDPKPPAATPAPAATGADIRGADAGGEKRGAGGAEGAGRKPPPPNPPPKERIAPPPKPPPNERPPPPNRAWTGAPTRLSEMTMAATTRLKVFIISILTGKYYSRVTASSESEPSNGFL